MESQKDVKSITQATEELVRQYFESKGWSATKLDKPRKDSVIASDWLFSNDNHLFLCEVKTITSVRKGLHTEAHFTKFNEMVCNHFSKSSLSNAALSVSIHSHTIYQPSLSEAKDFINWLEGSLSLLRDDKYMYGWTRDEMPWGSKFYFARYTFKGSAGKKEPSFSVHVSTTTSSSLEVQMHIYGNLHADKIDDNVLKARSQLEETAQRQFNPAIPRVAVIAFRGTSGGSIELEWHIVSTRIRALLQASPNLSAIAIIGFTTIEKYQGEDIIEWIVTEALSPVVPYFIVFHNRWLVPSVKSLDISTFFDQYSIQLSLI
jgi:hypothetical protein